MLYTKEAFAGLELGKEHQIFEALKVQLLVDGQYATFRWNTALFFVLIDTFKTQPPALKHLYFKPKFCGCETVQELKDWLTTGSNKKLTEIVDFAYRTSRFEGRKPLLEQIARTSGVSITQSMLLGAGPKLPIMLSITVEFVHDDDDQVTLLSTFLESLYDVKPSPRMTMDDQFQHRSWPWIWWHRDEASRVGPLRDDFKSVRDAGAVVRCLSALTYVLLWRVGAAGTDIITSVEESGDSLAPIYGARAWHGAGVANLDVDSNEFMRGSYTSLIEREMRVLRLRGKDSGKKGGDHCIPLGEQSNYFLRLELADHGAHTIGIVTYILKAPFVCRGEALTLDHQNQPAPC